MPQLDPELWIFGLVSLAFAGALGFIAGLMHGRSEFERTLKRAGKKTARVVELLEQSLDQADRVCTALNGLPATNLAPSRIEAIEGRQRKLTSLLAAFLDACRNARPTAAVLKPKNKKARRFDLRWQREPACEELGLPTRAAFEANLAAVLGAASASQVTCGLLLVAIDKFDQLRQRIGSVGADALFDQFSRVLLTSVREDDLVCRFNGDTFAVLLPEVDPATGRLLADGIRDIVRSHRFHLDALGPEVLVTASFGYGVLGPDDNADLVLGRAAEALKRSRSRGRNQLHVHDGRGVDLCATSGA